ncbi:MAG: hypoxanthine phosphoribosyltransferase [Candidatus Avilachnospira sp.]|jgi:hypoxanthine phosphoribosyltransferase
MAYHIEKLIDEREVIEGIKKVAEKINRDYQGKSIRLVCILKGGVFFLTELSKYLEGNITIDFMSVSSYGAGTVSSGIVKIIKDLDESIEGENVIVIEDIVDTGNTLSYLLELLRDRKPASVKLCTLLDKPSRRTKDIQADYVAFTIPDKFVVGFGLDYDQCYRNLPYVGVVEFDD